MLTPEQAKIWAKVFCPPPKPPRKRRARRRYVKKKVLSVALSKPSVAFTDVQKKTILWNALYGDSKSINWWLLLLMTREDVATLAAKVEKSEEELVKLYQRFRCHDSSSRPTQARK